MGRRKQANSLPTGQDASRGQEVKKSQIEAVCDCGCLTLKPDSDFESHNGGLTVKRSRVRIVDDDGNEVERLRGTKRYCQCNACINDWK